MPIVTKQKKWGPEYIQGSAPSVLKDGLTWYDTSSNELKVWHAQSSSWRWAATGSGARFGYVCGGGITTYYTGIQRIDFPFQSAIALQVGNIETPNNAYCSGCNSSEYGFIIAGLLSPVVGTVHVRRFEFPFQSGLAENMGNIVSAKNSVSGCNSSLHGYSIGGINSETWTYFSSIDRILFPFSSGDASVVGNITGSRKAASSSNSSLHGYTMGGLLDVPSFVSFSNIDRITFPFNSGTASHTANLARTGWFNGSLNSSQHSYTFCQASGTNNTFVDRFAFPFNSGTAAVVGSLSTPTNYANGLNSTQKGYICGGRDNTNKIVNFQELQFPFDSGVATNRGIMSSPQDRPTCIDGVDFVTQFI